MAKAKAGFATAVQPDTALAAVVGSEPLPRTQIVSKLWDYIKKNSLQDPKDKRKINGDAVLTPIFDGKKQIGMMELAKYISNHIKK